MYHNAQSLPFSPDQLQFQYLNINLNTPPVMVQYQGDPRLQQMAPFVTAATALEIQNNSQKNPLRMFMANQYMYNNCQNKEFHELVCAILDYMTVGLMSRTYQHEEHAAQVCVPLMVELACAANVQMFPMLERYVQNPQATQAAIAAFHTALNEITQLRQRNMGGGNMNMGMSRGGGGASWGPSAPAAWGPGPGQNNGYSQQNNIYSPPPRNYNGSHGPVTPSRSIATSPGNNGLFVSERGGNMQTVNTSRGGSKYNDHTQIVNDWPAPAKAETSSIWPENNVTIKQPVVARENKMQTNARVTEILAKESNLKWKPTVDQPYLPAYNPVEQQLVYCVNESNVIVEAKVVNRKEALMDYQLHELGTVFGNTVKETNFAGRIDTINAISVAIKKVNAASESFAKPDADENNPEITTYIKKEQIAATSLQEAWFITEIDRLEGANGDIPDVYRAYATVAYPIVTDKDEKSVVEFYGTAETFLDLYRRLKGSVNDLDPELWNLFNRRMTKLVNRLLKQDLSIPELTIDSFALDIEDLINHLIKKYGQAVYNAFVKHQKAFIESTFMLMYPDTADHLSGMYLDGKLFKQGVPKITFMASKYSLTYLNCSSHELGLELSKNTAAMVTAEATPIVHELLKGLMDDIIAHNAHFDRHLIRTNDLHVMEFTTGLLNEDALLLTLVK